nr:PREDICTED: interferon regulatory factor 8-like [Latimeria chalumnae]|eukprot:XP_006010095.1 PREDICTED: interferon regulatory factor 8-like [Latimeria chalumnae]
MAMGRIRSTRKLKQWMINQINSKKYSGLVWDDSAETMFRIPWKHAGKQDFRHDEDAAIFKAWAMFKGKFKSGDKIDPATWKTRLRCALNKSPEFVEVPARSQLDISEPYKVYRIVPLEQQKSYPQSASKVKRLKLKKEEEKYDSKDEKMEVAPPAKTESVTEPVEENVWDSSSSSLSPVESLLENTVDTIQDTKAEESGEQIETTVVTATNWSGDAGKVALQPVMRGSAMKNKLILYFLFSPEMYYMQITCYYGALEVLQKTVYAKDCKIASGRPLQASKNGLNSHTMERILLPDTKVIQDPVKRDATGQLLPFLERGIMLASNNHGIFIQRLCRGRVFWNGPCAPHQDRPNKLERDTLVKLFDTKKFLEELQAYKMKLGPEPQFQVTLCFGEEFPDAEPINDKLITLQIEQEFARQHFQEAQEIAYSFDLVQELLANTPSNQQFMQML